MGIQHSSHIHPIPIPMGILIPTAALLKSEYPDRRVPAGAVAMCLE